MSLVLTAIFFAAIHGRSATEYGYWGIGWFALAGVTLATGETRELWIEFALMGILIELVAVALSVREDRRVQRPSDR